jgi:hypothetical protein
MVPVRGQKEWFVVDSEFGGNELGIYTPVTT